MKLTVVLAVLIGTLVLACSTVTPVPAEPTPNIDGTVEARVAQERAVDATVQAKVSGTLSAQEAKTPNTTKQHANSLVEKRSKVVGRGKIQEITPVIVASVRMVSSAARRWHVLRIR